MTPRFSQTVVGGGTLALAALVIVGASTISTEAGYGGVGPNFLPWVVGVALAICGGFLVYEARSGGFREMEEPSGAPRGDWQGFGWVSAGILLNALLITTVGFILSCTLCFVLAVRGLRHSEDKRDSSARRWLVDIAGGLAISAPVYWMFTHLLAINLPGLSSSGWL